MHRVLTISDPVRRWQRFCRPGRRMAGMFVALWVGATTILFRLAPAPDPAGREPPPRLRWWPGNNSGGMDARTLWSPAAFALPTPAGFSHSLRDEKVRLSPPVQAAPPAPALLARPAPPTAADFTAGGWGTFRPPAAAVASTPRVFAPRGPGRESARLEFSAGWESRLFSGVDFNYGAWTNAGWAARMELRFDARGVPESVLVAQSSGLPDVDRRLARSAYGWRLLDPAAPRTGAAAWHSPGPVPAPPAGEDPP